MPPEAILAIFSLVEEAVKQEPAIAADIKSLFSSGAPTPADWAKLRANVSAESYGMFVPDSALSTGS